jgi:large subunit ribosomal protein L22
MQVKAVSKYNRISARKTRLVADMVRGQKASTAFGTLKFTPKKAARLVEKTLKSAVANAENNFGIDKKDLVISTILVDEGPTLKRHRPRARGVASAIRKRTAHVTIVVEGEKKTVDKKKPEKKTEKVTQEKK